MSTDNTEIRNDLDAELAELPEKYRGKTLADLAKMHREAEQALSRQGQELGEYRRLATTLLELEQSDKGDKPKNDPKPVEITTDDLFADPNAAIEKAIESHPEVRRATETANKLERELAQRDFVERHPEFINDAKDAKFVDWVKASPMRLRLAQRADGWDLEAADELAALWEERKGVLKEVEQARKDADEVKRREAEKAGTLEGSSGATASSETIYNRAELRELNRLAKLGDRAALAKWNDPKFQEARRAAYRDGRVK